MGNKQTSDDDFKLVDRLRGNYVSGIGGKRDFTPYVLPISIEAADRIEKLEQALKYCEEAMVSHTGANGMSPKLALCIVATREVISI